MKRTKKDRENAGKYGICLACGAGRTIMLTLDESGTFELQISCPKGHPVTIPSRGVDSKSHGKQADRQASP